MARSDQTEDAADLEAAAAADGDVAALPAAPDDASNGDAPAVAAGEARHEEPPADDERPELAAGEEQPKLPAGDESPALPAAEASSSEDSEPSAGADAEGGPTASAHDLLAPVDTPRGAPEPSTKKKRPSDAAPEPLVSGDPLLLGPRQSEPPEPPRAAAMVPPPPAGPAPPPPAAQSVFNDESLDMLRPTLDPGIGAAATGTAAPAARQQPARRAARGAHVSAEHAVVPAVRPVQAQQPTATLRPTTVAPVPRLAGRRPRVRRVTRVVRHIDPWSTFKVAAVFSAVAYAIALVAGVLLWNVAYATGTIDNIERGMESTGWETFELDGAEIFHNAWIGGLFVAVGMTGLAVLAATLFNLITDLVGGIRMTVLEEEVIEKTASPMRRFATRREAPGAEERVRRARGG